MLGAKRGTAVLCEHCDEWSAEAEKLIAKLRIIFGDYAADIQHIGSTAIKGIKAKPIIDIAIGVKTFENLNSFLAPLSDVGIYISAGQPFENIVLFSRDDAESGYRINNIQVVIYGSEQWNSHIAFRNYMNSHPDKAAEYEEIKDTAASSFSTDVSAYSQYKSSFIQSCINEAHKENVTADSQINEASEI